MALTLEESIERVKENGINFVKAIAVENEKELEKALEKISYPIAMKISSSKISHKTDVGGVKINLKNKEESRQAFSELKKIKGFEKAVVQEMVDGEEIIIGGKRDVQFGATILVGLGGIFVEIFKDYSLRVCPIGKREAGEMLKELKSYPILKGARGKKAINIDALKEMILKASEMMYKNEKIMEIDLNPVFVNEKEAVAVDARIVLE